MGRRKFHCIVRKNGERKKYATPTSLVISIPTSKLPTSNIDSLESQLSTSKPLSWTLTAVFEEEYGEKLVICYIETPQQTPIIKYSITIRQDFSWFLGVFGNTLMPQSCPVLRYTPDTLDSVDRVLQFISVIESSKICRGNSEEKFMELAKRRIGVFKNHSGKRDTINLL